MKNLIIAGLFIFLFIPKMLAQKFQGKAVYQSQREIKFSMDSTKVGNEMMKKIQKKMNEQFQKEYTLTFNQKESIYQENEKLDTPDLTAGRMDVKISSGRNVLYRNTGKETYVSQQTLLGKLFLVKGPLEQPNWKLEDEIKKIGKYTCFKATLSTEVTRVDFFSDEEGKNKTTETRTTTVWYTPEIPVNMGPGDYWGLPGLILEVQGENFSLLCTKILLNPEKEIVIQIPDKGTEIDQKAFEKLQKKKTEEWMERNSSTKNGERVISIKVGG